jgi:hypothetical protein
MNALMVRLLQATVEKKGPRRAAAPRAGNLAPCREEEIDARARIAGSGEQVIDAVHDAQATRAEAAA